MILLFERTGWGMPQEYFGIVEPLLLLASFGVIILAIGFFYGFIAGMRHAARKTKEFEHLK